MVNLKSRIDFLVSILVIFSLFSVIKYVNPLIFIFVIGVVIFNYYNEKNSIFHINRHLLTVVGFVATIYIFLNTSLNTLVNSLIHILAIFICIKFLEEKKYRDYMQLVLLSVFLITASGLMNIGMIFIFYIIIAIFLSNTIIIFLTIYDNAGDARIPKADIKSLTIKSSIIPVLSIPFAMFLFFVIPRTPTPMFDFLSYQDTSKSGFTSKINLGQVSSIQEDNRIALRVKMPEIDSKHLYWRGVVFDRYVDGKWESSEADGIVKPVAKKATFIEYEAYLEPTGEKYLIMLDKPYRYHIIGYKGILTEKLEIKLNESITKKIYYTGRSFISDYLEDDYSDIENSKDISSISREIRTLAGRFYNKDPYLTIKKIEEYFKNNFTYTTQELPKSKNPVEDFLFNSKKGNCEYFASATALLLRANGLPARLVGGYAGGFYNKQAGYYAVANKNAHVWVEVFISNRWYRVDTTPVSIDQLTEKRLPLTFKLKLYLDAINYYWTKFVINYDLNTQITLAFKISSSVKSLNFNINKTLLVFIGAFVLLVTFLFWIFLKKKEQLPNRYLDLFYRILSNKGIKTDPSLTIDQNIDRIDDATLMEQSRIFARYFNEMLFKDGKIDKNILKSIIKKMKKG